MHPRTASYNPEKDAAVHWENTERGVLVSAVRGQWLYNNFSWPNPVVIEVKNFQEL